jgi:alcohol dehydrogenase (cytochrome c)
VKSINPKTGALIDPVYLKKGEEGTICPYLLSVRSWNHGAYNPKTGLWYNNAMEACNTVIPAPTDPDSLGSLAALTLGVSKIVAVPPPGESKATARFDARDPITGKTKWSINYPLPGLGDVMTTAGGLVFNGDPRGILHAYDANDGKDLWNFNVGSGMRGGIVSYAVNGTQYIVVATGWGSLAPGFMSSIFPEVNGIPGGAALVAFKLKK